jgi:hypothetical protein
MSKISSPETIQYTWFVTPTSVVVVCGTPSNTQVWKAASYLLKYLCRASGSALLLNSGCRNLLFVYIFTGHPFITDRACPSVVSVSVQLKTTQ